jgi:hypothetical protein
LSNGSAQYSAVSTSAITLYPKVCRNADQFKAWQKTRPWLSVKSDLTVFCIDYADVGSLGLHTGSSQHVENAFAKGTVKPAKDAHALLKKIDMHRDSDFHDSCKKFLKKGKK